MGNNLNENPRERFAIVSACTDTWKDTMMSRHNNQEERVLSLEHSLLVMYNTIQGSQTLFLGLQAEYRRMDEIITKHKAIIPRLHLKVETSSWRVNTVLTSVEERMKEFETWINEVRQSNMDTGVPMGIVNSLNEIIQEGAPSAVVKVMKQQVRELSGGVQNDRQATDDLRGLVVGLQDKFDSASLQGMSSILSQGDLSPQP